MSIDTVSIRLVGAMVALTGFTAGCTQNAADSAEVPFPVATVAGDTTSSLVAPSVSDESTSQDTAATTPVGAGFFCGEFGSEQLPSLVALDLATGEQRWQMCDDATAPALVLGRSVGVTLLQRQGNIHEMYAVDDNGVELWNRPNLVMLPNLIVGESTAVTFDDVVAALDVRTGVERWQHELEEGTPIAAALGLVVEVVAATNPADAGLGTMRALDAISGEMRWSRDIQLVPAPLPNLFSPTSGNAVLAVPTSSARDTDVIDIATGTDLRRELGVLTAMGDLLVEFDRASFRTLAVSDALTGDKLAAAPDGVAVPMNRDAENILAGTELVISAGEPAARTPDYYLFDASSGETTWTIERGWTPVARSNENVLLTAGQSVRLHDSATGLARWEFSAPSSRVMFGGFAMGSDLVVLVPTFVSD